ncbi:mitochondrial enoyl-CoA hydratase [Suhomyces tanzawaensis NRRL Y-17324]|uniref:3-hydroxyisobutyryl-CoA hydrolase n=1 Tax=Suhomyces tanzawaensis NRRL Y-17324 TaxID=984487 RepID=A0A1E4SLS0_9ASCO|nr:mitochondrial enoyl-CoA hydratase [Suhomyces tanzawaensis NRRL Y-17324]ODV80347.1 mitochondrial enoyl-CoA hydratase [Suhomyces tanzawaensis NRRL Y-17324]
MVSTASTTAAAASDNVNGHAEAPVLFSNKNNARLIHLNRLKKLNSLNTEMVELITPRLLEYAKSSASNVVILTSNSPKALCAGGDVAECATQIAQGNPGYASDFFQKEYNLNYLISTYSKPYISLMDGITMGGGVGLSVHAPFRVATEKTKLAMPEMDIGFFPDVGTTFFLPRLDHKLGYYYALTGEILSGIDAYFAGFATHYVNSDKIPQLINRLSNLQPPVINDNKTTSSEIIFNNAEYFAQVNQVIEEFTENKLPDGAKYPFSAEQLTIIRTAFSQPSVDAIFDYLNKEGSEFSQKIVKKLSAKPISSLKVAFELLNKGQENTIKKQLELEMVAATNVMNQPVEKNDFVKGVTHKLIKKIKEPPIPDWNPASEIDEKYVKDIVSSSMKTVKFLQSPLIHKFFGIDYKQYPFNMGLPNTTEVANFITGNDGSNRSYLPTPFEVTKHFERKTDNKLGVKEKIESILELHGDVSKYDGKYVSWKA